MDLNGKVIDFLGDSITEGVGVTEDYSCRYDNVLKKLYNLAEINNYGISGTRLAYQSKVSDHPNHDLFMAGRMFRLSYRADIIVVYGGINDYGHGDAPFGTMTDETPMTYCGAVDYMMRNLPILYPNAKVVFMTPFHMTDDDKPSTNPLKQADARPLVDYVNVIVEKGKQYNIPVLNLYTDLLAVPGQDVDLSTCTVDGLHLNAYGHSELAKLLGSFLEQL